MQVGGKGLVHGEPVRDCLPHIVTYAAGEVEEQSPWTLLAQFK